MAIQPSTARPPTDAAWHHRALVQAARSFEAAVAAPVRDRDWWDRVGQRLADLRAEFTEHVATTEGPDGRYAALLADAPRLSRQVAALAADHDRLQVRMDALARRVGRPGTGVRSVRDAAGDLLAHLARHRQRGADLVYEAYATDIGGET
ncbi:MAG TPA: hemerythrin domain-containing protein [Natronosporangium sp.]